MPFLREAEREAERDLRDEMNLENRKKETYARYLDPDKE